MTISDARRKMVYALRIMSGRTKKLAARQDTQFHKLTSRWFEHIKKQRKLVGVSDETRQKMSKSMMGKNVGKVASVETRLKMSKARKGRKASDERIQQQREQMTREWASGSRAESNKKTAETRRTRGWKGAMFGKKHSEETKRLMAQSALNRKINR